jgi:demethoxyubiquinone hydroxylase (CLK1/Coq7/Cat5 family)
MEDINMKDILRRTLRVVSFALGAGIAGLGAGSAIGLTVAQSALMGALTGVLGIFGALAFIYAGKGSVSDHDFNATINSAIETARAKSESDKK